MEDAIKENIVNYYHSSQWIYNGFCYTPHSLGMHFGFWDANTKNRQEAIINENDKIIKIAGIKKGMKVLDAGCGVGGTALQIADKTEANVWGISITPQQIQLANKYAKQRKLEALVNFSVQDYTQTTFPSHFFDVIFGIESICHASPKSAFLNEAFRLLKPGGKLVIADGYLKRPLKNTSERQIITAFQKAFALHEFITEINMRGQIKESGFICMKSYNMLEAVEPSVRYFANLGRRAKIVCVTAKYIPISQLQALYKNYIATKMTEEGYKKGLVTYYIHIGEKPK